MLNNRGKKWTEFKGKMRILFKHFDSYKDEAQAPLIIAQIEDIKSVDNLESILNVDSLDATIIGPYDLSQALGLPGGL